MILTSNKGVILEGLGVTSHDPQISGWGPVGSP